MATLRAKKYSFKCAIPLCATTGSTGLHNFPSNPVQREKWLKICQLPEAKTIHRVCKIHFESSDYHGQVYGASIPRLMRRVVPSLFLPPAAVPSVPSVTLLPSVVPPDIEEFMDQTECWNSPVTEVRSRLCISCKNIKVVFKIKMRSGSLFLYFLNVLNVHIFFRENARLFILYITDCSATLCGFMEEI
jgi:hypothetical protein